MHLYNSLTRELELFEPLDPNHVGVYACGPTVYFYPQIGNWRTFVFDDLLVRTLKYFGYTVTYVMNITDVGHLTGDNLGDSSAGEDRLEKAAKRENKTAWDVAEFYTQDFIDSYRKLNLTMPRVGNQEGFCKATDHIAEQIEMVKAIEAKEFTYKISDGIYFDVQAYEQVGNTYGLMSNLHIDASQARVEENKEKKDSRDFALWKFSYPGGRSFDSALDDVAEQRQMEWESPWGLGFPGWHIECSAMATKYLGEQFDLHMGGEDHKSTHHPNEIAQAEAVTGKKPFVKYWLHGAFLQVDGGRMGKSLGNAYTLHDVIKRGYTPMHLRYFYLTGHWRQPLNFTWESLDAAKEALEKIYRRVEVFGAYDQTDPQTQQPSTATQENLGRFRQALEDDLNMPKALAVVYQGLKEAKTDGDAMHFMEKIDQVLGLQLVQIGKQRYAASQEIPEDVMQLFQQRNALKTEKQFAKADELRDLILKKGFTIEDRSQESYIKKAAL